MILTRTQQEKATIEAVKVLKTFSHTQNVVLEDLSPEEIVTLTASQLKVEEQTLPTPVSQLIRERAGGNPLFAQELILMLQQREIIAVTFDNESGTRHCILQGDIDQIKQELPGTLQGLLLARIDHLAPEQQLILKFASVIGRTFRYFTLAYLGDQQTDVN